MKYIELIKKKISDTSLIKDAIDDYMTGNFQSMFRIIDEYNSHEFFQDLYEFFNCQEWRSRENKYLTFVGMTIQYMKFRPGETERIVLSDQIINETNHIKHSEDLREKFS